MFYQINSCAKFPFAKQYQQMVLDLRQFFNFSAKISGPAVLVIPDRKTIDVLKGRKTEGWLVGWSDKKGVFILSSDNYEKESSHKFILEDYLALLKHEMVHYFTEIYSQKNSFLPVWLLEGLAIYLSGQYRLRFRVNKYQNFLDFVETGGTGVYSESGFAVEFLVKKYGKRKMLALLKGSVSVKSFPRFFKDIYGFSLNYKNFQILK